MPREPKPAHRPYLTAVQEAAQAEQTARERAEEQVREVVAISRNTTDKAIATALAHGVTKENIREVLGISYTTLYVRIREYENRTTPAPTTSAAEPTAEPAITNLVVTKDDGVYRVDLIEFAHPDLGAGLTGTVYYDEDGEFKTGEFAQQQGDDPLWMDKLWATTEVQDAIANA